MKRIIFLLLAVIPAMLITAQETIPQDTTLFIGNRKFVVKENDGKLRVKVFEEIYSGDTIRNDQIFEGIYRDGQSSEQRFSVSVPFMNRQKSRNKHYFDPHSSGFYLGYYQMGDGFLGFGSADDLDLVASKSWEWGINLFDGAIRFFENWGLTGGLGFGYTSYRLDNNQAFIENENRITQILDAPEDVTYRKSRLRYYHLRLPINIEWQKRFGWKGPLFFSMGAEIETRLWTKSIAVVNGKKQTLNKDLNVRPLGVNILLQAGYSDWGFYCRYSTASLFENNKGPELYPYSFGIKWFW